MHVEATTAQPVDTGADTIALGLFQDEEIEVQPDGADLEGLLRSGEASGDLGKVAVAHGDGRRFMVVGLGDRAGFNPERARRAAAAADRRAGELSARELCWKVPAGSGEPIAQALIEGTLLHAYRFGRYKPPGDRRAIERLVISADRDFTLSAGEAAVLCAAQNRARDLGNTPANDLPPSALADYALRLAAEHESITISVLDGEAIRNRGMGAFAAVAQGSEQSARLIQIDHEGAGSDRSAPRLALVGKGITFDSGGLSLKPPATMHDMKFDMCGAAAVIEAIAALAELGAPVRVLGVIGAAENLPGPAAVKPGDIVRALDGTTIEVINTDAEGRLVLADCLCHARQRGAERIVDIATLTGAVQTALGSVYAGVMANDDTWAEQVLASAERAGEPLWRLPLGSDYAEMVKGRYAQLTNRAERREAQAITAAELLHHFAGEVPWAHIDIAGTAWDVPRPYFVGKGATGFGVRLLVELARSQSGVR